MQLTALEVQVRAHFSALAHRTEEMYGPPVLSAITEYLSLFLDAQADDTVLFSRIDPDDELSASMFGFNAEIVFSLSVEIKAEYDQLSYSFTGPVVPRSAVSAIRFLPASNAAAQGGRADFAKPEVEIIIEGADPVRIGGDDGLKSSRRSWEPESENTWKSLFGLLRRSPGAAR